MGAPANSRAPPRARREKYPDKQQIASRIGPPNAGGEATSLAPQRAPVVVGGGERLSATC
jgi:hypothetical protein